MGLNMDGGSTTAQSIVVEVAEMRKLFRGKYRILILIPT